MLRSKYISICFLLCILFSCVEDEPVISQEADIFLQEILNIMQTHSINRQNLNWTDFRDQVKSRAGAAQKIEDTYDAIQLALTLLGDNHSSFRKPDGNILMGDREVVCSAAVFNLPVLPDNIGYISVQGFSGGSDADNTSFAEKIQSEIMESDTEEITGWIVDLRGNTGGNMWPMLAGVGPILGEGVAGYFVDPDNSNSAWGYFEGASTFNQNPVVQVSDPYVLKKPNPKVAVLLDNAVASSGEAIAISFIERENTKSFGSATCGLSTSNRNFNLANGHTLLLTNAYMADRNLNLFGSQIIPDVSATMETIVGEAIQFLND